MTAREWVLWVALFVVLAVGISYAVAHGNSLHLDARMAVRDA